MINQQNKVKARTATVWVAAIAYLTAVIYAARQTFIPLRDPAQVPGQETQQDFRDALYYPIRDFFSGHNPYRPEGLAARQPTTQEFDLYSPIHLLIHAPITIAPYQWATVMFFVVNLGMYAALVVLGLQMAQRALGGKSIGVPTRWLGVDARWFFGLMAFLVFSQIGRAQLFLGQINPLIAVAVAGVLYTVTTHPRLAALALSVALIKPQYGVIVLLLLAGSRWLKIVRDSLALSIAATTIPVIFLVIFSGGFFEFIDDIKSNLSYAQSTPYGDIGAPTADRIDTLALIARISGYRPGAALQIAYMLCVVAMATVIVVRYRKRHDVGAGLPPDISALIVLVVLVTLVHQPGDVLIFFPVLIALGFRLFQRWNYADGAVFLLGALPFALSYRMHLYVENMTSQLWAGAVIGMSLNAAFVAALGVSVFRYVIVRKPKPVAV